LQIRGRRRLKRKNQSVPTLDFESTEQRGFTSQPCFEASVKYGEALPAEGAPGRCTVFLNSAPKEDTAPPRIQQFQHIKFTYLFICASRIALNIFLSFIIQEKLDRL
jgi:hypothetical protein